MDVNNAYSTQTYQRCSLLCSPLIFLPVILQQRTFYKNKSVIKKSNGEAKE
jgi:hypothetical protein